MKRSLIGIGAAVITLVIASVRPAQADPLPGEVLKFYQTPLDNGATNLPPGGSLPPGSIPALWPGHDELSTAYFNASGNFYQGQYMADDFCDYKSTPIVHVMWWGSYMNGMSGTHVKQFLIVFETDVPATGNTNSHPGSVILAQVVSLGALAPHSGTYTETPVPIPAGPPNPDGNLYKYNAELATPAPESSNVVEWIKIVALVDTNRDGLIQWGWHNRDYGVEDPLACMPPTLVPGEFNSGGPTAPIWHFQDDAVTGPVSIFAVITGNGTNIEVQQNGYSPTFYVPPYDGISSSKDLAFALYTMTTQPPPPTNTVVIDENGNGTLNTTQTLAHSFQIDTGPCGSAVTNVLTYHLPTPYVGTTGDVVLLEPQTGRPSDLLRFNGDGTVMFYSDVSPTDPADSLADVGLPCQFYTNMFVAYEVGPEGSNGLAYTPVPGGPGWDPNYPVTFNFLSDVPPTITIDEDGKGSVNGLPITGVLTNDPGPTGQPQALTYPLPFPGLPGDVFLTESPAGGPPSDIIRFNGNSTVVFYSDPFTVDTNDCPDSLADGAGPTVFLTPTMTIPEVGGEGFTNGATYTPTSGEPGYDPSGPTYVFISDYPPVVADPFTAWQLKYFGCTNCAQAAGGADPDGDGMINTNEFLTGTDPTNSASYFHITSIVRQGVGSNDLNITWTARPCKVYIVQVFPGNAPDGSYSNNFTDIATSLTIGGVSNGGFLKGDSITNYVDVGGATNKPSRYYRVRLVP